MPARTATAADRRTRAGTRAEDPGRGSVREEERGESEDEHESGRNERGASDDRTERAGDAPGARRSRAVSMPVPAADCTPRSRLRIHRVSSTVCVRRTGRAATRCVRVVRRIPCNLFVPTGRRPCATERGARRSPCAITRPAVDWRSAPRGLEELDDVARRVEEQDLLAARSVDDVVAERSRRRRASRSTSPSRSSTMKWMRFHPPGPGLAPSAIGRPAELVGSRTGAAGGCRA